MPNPSQKTLPIAPPVDPGPCQVTENADHSLTVTFIVEPMAARRAYMKASGMPIARFLYENILKRAIDTNLF